MRTMGRLAVAGLAVAWILAGCAGGEAADAPVADSLPAAAAAGEEGLIPGTPAGGLVEWIADIHAGLEGVDRLAATDGMAAQRQALEQYIGRQEYIELYYGPGGRLVGGDAPELGVAVDSSESRFHVLMRMALESGDSVATRRAVEALRAEHGRVLEAARAAGVALTPRGAGGSEEEGRR